MVYCVFCTKFDSCLNRGTTNTVNCTDYKKDNEIMNKLQSAGIIKGD